LHFRLKESYKCGDLVMGFITSNDITGGNSGSPVINANGELIGLAFDGNKEILSHKLAFDTNLNRTINVAIRHLLCCIDKLGGASNIIQELTPEKIRGEMPSIKKQPIDLAAFLLHIADNELW
jgi:hypothetical protein